MLQRGEYINNKNTSFMIMQTCHVHCGSIIGGGTRVDREKGMGGMGRDGEGGLLTIANSNADQLSLKFGLVYFSTALVDLAFILSVAFQSDWLKI